MQRIVLCAWSDETLTQVCKLWTWGVWLSQWNIFQLLWFWQLSHTCNTQHFFKTIFCCSFYKDWKLCILSKTLNSKLLFGLYYCLWMVLTLGFYKYELKSALFQCRYMVYCYVKGLVEKFYKIMLCFHEFNSIIVTSRVWLLIFGKKIANLPVLHLDLHDKVDCLLNRVFRFFSFQINMKIEHNKSTWTSRMWDNSYSSCYFHPNSPNEDYPNLFDPL